jgi:hypothetical protein
LLYLILFSYFILCDFHYLHDDNYYVEILKQNNLTFEANYFNISHFNKEISALKRDIIKKPSYIEYLLIFWVFSLIIEEIRQVILTIDEKYTFKLLKSYLVSFLSFLLIILMSV